MSWTVIIDFIMAKMINTAIYTADLNYLRIHKLRPDDLNSEIFLLGN